MAQVNPYLNFMGKTEEAFNFYKSVFGNEFTTFQRFKDTPFGDRLRAEDKEKIMHVALPIGNGTMLMGTDTLESMGHTLTEGNNYSIAIMTDSREETEKLFNGLSEGGKIKVPLEDAQWGAYFGMFDDKYGIHWMVNYQYKK